IAILKSYITNTFDDILVKLIDLNEIYNKLILEKLKQGYENSSKQGNENHIEVVISAYKILLKAKKGESSFWEENKVNIQKLSRRILNWLNVRREKYSRMDFVPQSEISDLIPLLLNEKPSMIGFSIMYSSQYPFAMALVKCLKRQLEIPILIGGASAEYMSMVHKKAYKESGLYDFLLKGEGEIPLAKLIRSFKNEGMSKTKLKQSNTVEINNSEVICNLDEIPFPNYFDFNLSEYLNSFINFQIIGSRGCSWGKCTYCTLYKCSDYRARSIENIVNEIEYLSATFNIFNFQFFDSWLPPSRLRALSEEILRRDINIRFGFFARPIRAYNPELMKLAYRAGAYKVRWGVESGSPHVIDLMNKGTKVEHFEEVMKWCHEIGFNNAVQIIIGFPGETEDDYCQTVGWIEKAREYITSVNPSLFLLMKNSDIYHNPHKYGIRKLPENLFQYSTGTDIPFKRLKGANDNEVIKRYTHFRQFINELKLDRAYSE
ncbi:MAG: B12-binding domain-containing radical SAM protein, partial [Candidatus Hodarchaeota archaeon]